MGGASSSDVRRKDGTPRSLNVGEEKFEDISYSDLGEIVNPQMLKTAAVTPSSSSSATKSGGKVLTQEYLNEPHEAEDYGIKAPPLGSLPKVTPSPTHTECDDVSTNITPRSDGSNHTTSKHEFLLDENTNNLPPTFSHTDAKLKSALAAQTKNLNDLRLEELM